MHTNPVAALQFENMGQDKQLDIAGEFLKFPGVQALHDFRSDDDSVPTGHDEQSVFAIADLKVP